MKKRKRLQSLDRFLELPGDSLPAEDNLPVLADIIGAEIIADGACKILKIVDDIDIFPYSGIKDIDDHLKADLYQDWHFVTGGDEQLHDPGQFLFFDTETTGLSGGAGMVAFLCGFGYFHKGIFRVVQYFLPDYPEEPFLLQKAMEHIRPDTILVSYNGKAFDWPLLSQRLTINRMDIPSFAYHLDVLHPARSLFRRLGEDCTLITLEKCLLSFDRGEDIPGYLIPSKYFDYLYDRQPGMIPEIIRHNRLDIISLALVTRYVPEYLIHPERINSTPLLEGVINHCFKNKRYTSLIDMLARVSPGYLEDCSEVALLKYSLALKSKDRREEASQIWKTVSESKSGPQIYRHLLELAKYQEHSEKDPEAALDTVDLILSLEAGKSRKSQLIHRRNRLIKKLRHQSPKSL
jgi:uncharacterized protein YprB with RNaseH-like and TPR domain